MRFICLIIAIIIITTSSLSCSNDNNTFKNNEGNELESRKAVESSESENNLEVIETKWILEEYIKGKKVYYIEPAMKVHATYENKIYATSLDFNKLFYSEDGGLTWHLLETFNSDVQTVYFSPLGEMFVSTARDRFATESEGIIYKYNLNTKSFKEVLKLKSGASYIWNITGDEDGYMFISEYGYKSLPDNARRIYRSSDSGETWEIVYEPDERDNYHNHKIFIDDKNPNIIFQSVGDGDNNKIIKSEDRGDTWKEFKYMFNPISTIQTDDHFMWGADTHPGQGIFLMDRETGEIINQFFPEGFGGSVYDMIQVDDKVYAGFSSYDWESQWWDGSLWSTEDDGYTWKMEFNISKEPGYGIGFYKFVEVEEMIYINCSYYTNTNKREGKYTGTIRFKK